VGVEPASAASVAGLKKLRDRGDVDADERVVCLTTGHLLKDPDAAFEAGNEPEPVANDTDAVLDLLDRAPGQSPGLLRRLLPF
jgi:threonine synthase